MNVRVPASNSRAGLFIRSLLGVSALLVVFFVPARESSAAFTDLRSHYDYGPYYERLPAGARVLQATTAATVASPPTLAAGQVVSGYIEKFGETYYLGQPGAGLTPMNFAGIGTLGVNPATLVGQYVAFPVGTVALDGVITVGDSNNDGTADLAPVPPPTDPAAPASPATSGDIPTLPAPGLSPGNFLYFFERVTEATTDLVYNAVRGPEAEAAHALARAGERAAEVQELLVANEGAAAATAVRYHEAALAIVQERLTEIPQEKVEELEQHIVNQLTALEESLPTIPAAGEGAFQEAVRDTQAALDTAADTKDLPPLPLPAIALLHKQTDLGLLTQEQVAAIYQADSRAEARDKFVDFVNVGLLSEVDIKKSFDISQQARFPETHAATVEFYKLEALKDLEATRPSDDILQKLEQFGATYTPGTLVPPELREHWIKSIRQEEFQQTIRPDFLEKYARGLQAARPEDFAKFNELKERLKPSSEDVATIERFRAANPDAALPPALQRLQAFHDQFGLKAPEGWKPPAGLTGTLPFAGPGGTRTVGAANAFCASNGAACENYAPPSGITFTPHVGVRFEAAAAGAGGSEPGRSAFSTLGFGPAFQPPGFIANYYVPSSIAPPKEYVGPGGCKTPDECLKTFQDIKPEDRARQFGLFVAPPSGEAPRDSEGRPPAPAGQPALLGRPELNSGSNEFSGSSRPGEFGPYRGPGGSSSFSSGPGGPAPFHPSYAQPSGGNPPPGGQNAPPPGYQPFSGPGPGGSGNPPPQSGGAPYQGSGSAPQPGGGNPPPPPGGGSQSDSGNSPSGGDGGNPPPPPSDGGGGGEAPPPPPPG